MKRFFLLAVLVAGMSTAASCSKRVIARINGEKITYDQFQKELESSPLAQGILNDMLLERLMQQEADKKGVKVSEEEVTKLLNKQKEAAGENWEQQLKMGGLTEADLRKVYRRQLLVWRMFVSEEDARKYFEENRTFYDTPPQVRFRRIVLASKDEAEKTRKLILDDKAKFEDVAKQKSLETWSGQKGGEVGPTPIAAMVQSQPQLKDILEKQPPNEISEPVQNNIPEGSYQIVQVLERTPEAKAKFEEKVFEVYGHAFRARASEVNQAVNDMRSKATVEVLDPRFGSVREQWKMLKERRPTLGPEVPPPPQPQEPEPEKPAKPEGSKQSQPGKPAKSNEPPQNTK